MVRELRETFPDGTTWNTSDEWRLFFMNQELYNYSPAPDNRRTFRAIGRPVEIDLRLQDIRGMAYKGHMNPNLFHAVELRDTDMIELRFETNFYCEMGPKASARFGHQLLHPELWWVRIAATDKEMIICAACFHEHRYTSAFSMTRMLP